MRLGALLSVLCLLGCQAAPTPYLVQVTGISSDRLAEGDMLELRGTGFPEGRPARVTLRGDLYRPGRPTEHDFELVLPARSSSPHTVAASVTREVELSLAGPSAEHTTFRGSVEAAFFPLSPGMPPVTGGLSGAVIDIVPMTGEPPEARVAEARRFSEFVGVLFADEASLVVDGVMPKSAGERAGIARGDRVSELAGLRVLESSDLVPPPRARQVELVVHRNGVADPVRLVVETDGFTKLAARDLAAAFGVLAAALALFGILRSPLGRALSFLELRLVDRLRVRRELARLRELDRSSRRRAPAFFLGALPASPVALVALAVGTGLSMFLGVGGSIVAREVDLAVLTLASIVATTVAALVFGAPGERGVLARFRRALLVVTQSLPVALALGCAALESGGIGVDELARAQGALPWQWNAFRGPALLAATLVFAVSLVPEAGRGAGDDLSAAGVPKQSLVRAVPELVGWAHLVLIAGVGAFAFLGGTRALALGASPNASLSAALLGAGVLVLKELGLVLFVLFARAVLGRLDVRETKGLTLRVLLPIAAFALVATLLLQRTDVRPIAGALATTLGVSCFIGVTVLAVSFVRRVAAGAIGREAEPGVNPWI